jgi:hypothetical protein
MSLLGDRRATGSRPRFGGSWLLFAGSALVVNGCIQPLDKSAGMNAGVQNGSGATSDAGSGGPFPINLETPPLALPDGTTTTDACVANRAWAMDILKTDCAGCHAAPNDVGLPPWDFVLDEEKLTTTVDTRTNLLFVAPGDPDHSRVYQRMENGEMPPPPNSSVGEQLPRPSLSDLSAIRQWIVCIGTGSTAAGGTAGTTGTGGAAGSDGTAGAGGAAAAGGAGAGGATGSGGWTGAGGAAGTGGAAGSGGWTGAGGATGSGGTASAGGTAGAGGAAGTLSLEWTDDFTGHERGADLATWKGEPVAT